MKDTLAHLRYIVYQKIDMIREARKAGVNDFKYRTELYNAHRLYKAYLLNKTYNGRTGLR